MAMWLTAGTNFAVASFARSRKTPFRRIPDTEDRCFRRHRRYRRRQRSLRPISPIRWSACQWRRRPSSVLRQLARQGWRTQGRRQRPVICARSPAPSSSGIRQPSITICILHTYCSSLTLLPVRARSGPPATKTAAARARTRHTYKTFTTIRCCTVTALSPTEQRRQRLVRTDFSIDNCKYCWKSWRKNVISLTLYKRHVLCPWWTTEAQSARLSCGSSVAARRLLLRRTAARDCCENTSELMTHGWGTVFVLV